MLPRFDNYEKSCYKQMCQYFWRHNFLTHLYKYPGTQLWDCMVSVSLALQETAKLSSKAAVPFCIPTLSYVGSFLSLQRRSVSLHLVLLPSSLCNLHLLGFMSSFPVILLTVLQSSEMAGLWPMTSQLPDHEIHQLFYILIFCSL